MLIPSEKSRHLTSLDSGVFFNQILNQNGVTPSSEIKLSASYDTSKSKGEFPVVNCICIGEIDGRCVRLK